MLPSLRAGLDAPTAMAWLASALLAAALVILHLDLREAARRRRDFATGLSHEVRTSVAHIRTFNEMLLLGQDRSEEERQRWLEVIDRATYRLADRAENLLLTAHSAEQRRFPARRLIDLGDLLEDVAAYHAPDAAARQIAIVVHSPASVSALVDPSAARLVLVNLVDNALRYGPEGKMITLDLRYEAGNALIAVADEGPGIAPRDRKRVWEPFVRLSRPDQVEQGSGLGLAVVRQVAEAHGGRAYVEDAAGGGARFCIVLPALAPANAIPSLPLVASS
ncbi:hypothetical protein BH23GEM7_BH23GEM7_33840 [soil metagenome]